MSGTAVARAVARAMSGTDSHMFGTAAAKLNRNHSHFFLMDDGTDGAWVATRCPVLTYAVAMRCPVLSYGVAIRTDVEYTCARELIEALAMGCPVLTQSMPVPVSGTDAAYTGTSVRY
eukprot:3817311-Rhodomonas_salina.3